MIEQLESANKAMSKARVTMEGIVVSTDQFDMKKAIKAIKDATSSIELAVRRLSVGKGHVKDMEQNSAK